MFGATPKAYLWRTKACGNVVGDAQNIISFFWKESTYLFGDNKKVLKSYKPETSASLYK